MPAATNPYIIDGPIQDSAAFFGRQAITQAITEVLRYPPNTSVIVYGQRKMGKSSLLRHLERALKPPFFPVYFDLAGKAMDSVSQVLHEMAVAAANNAGIAPPPAADFENNPAAFHTQFLPMLYQALGHQQQPTFLLDEFDPIDIPETELPETAAVRNLDTYLYQLLTTQSHTDFVFAAGRRMNELNNVQASGYQADLTQFLSVLTPEQSRALILQPGAPPYADDALAYILDATRGHPYLTQLLCHTLFEQTQPRPGQPITLKDVKAAQAALLGATDNAIPQIWESIPDAEQLTLAAAAEAAATPHAAIPPVVLENTLTGADVPVTLPQIRRAPQNLVNWQMLEQTGSGYTFHIDLLRRWVAANRPLSQIKEAELAHLSPKTDQLYQLALLAHRRGDSAEALAKLDEALAANPNHLAALTLKGEILTEQNQPAEAVVTYEKAYKLNPLLAAGALAGALALLGQQQEQAGNAAAALESYRRALRLDPKNKPAAARKAIVTAQLAPPVPADAPTPQPAPQPTQPDTRRNWWPLALAALLLLLLCGWLYSSGMIGQPATATSTSVAQTGATDSGPTGAAASHTATRAAETAAADSIATAAAATIAAAGSSDTTATATNQAQAAASLTATPDAAATNASADNATATAAAVSAATASAPLSGVITIGGSPELGPLFQALAAQFSSGNPNVQFNISGSGSQAGLNSVLAGGSDIALLGRDLSPDELAALNGAQLFTLPQQDDIAVVVHPLIPVADLSADQVRDMFTGSITNWQEVGGPDAPLVRVLPGAESDTRQVFQQQIMGADVPLSEDGAVIAASDDEVPGAVTSLPNAIGFTAAVPPSPESRLASIASTESWPVIDTGLLAAKTLTINQAAPGSDAYPVRRPINLVAAANPSAATEALIDFIYSPEGQRIIEQLRRAQRSAP